MWLRPKTTSQSSLADSTKPAIDERPSGVEAQELRVYVNERRTVLRQEPTIDSVHGKCPRVRHELPRELAQAWLIWQSRMIAGTISCALFVPRPESKEIQTFASWPDAAVDVSQLAGAAESALGKLRSVVRARVSFGGEEGPASDLIAHPVAIDGTPVAAVVLRISTRPEPQQLAVQQLLQWGCMWLEVMVGQKSLGNTAQAGAALDFVAAASEDASLGKIIQIIVDGLSERFDCERVCIGFCRGLQVRLKVMSHNDAFDPRTQIVRSIEAAMEEAVDQSTTLVFPVEQQSESVITRAHGELSKLRAGGAICSLPLSGNTSAIGVVTLERDPGQAFAGDTIEMLETIVRHIGPILQLKLRDERSFLAKAFEALRKSIAGVLGGDHLKLKSAVVLLTALVATLSIVDGQHRVTARASLEGAILRVIVAPQDGYIKDAGVRAGDLVKKGQLLVSLDDSDLKLERLNLVSKQEVIAKKHHEALAKHDRVGDSILQARIAQVQAQLELVDEKLERAQLRAPFDGVVASGDLSHFLGSAVEIGQTLFEVAPLNSYRVVLKVNEWDVARLHPGQRGKLVVAALPQAPFDILVDRIMPIAVSDQRQIFYRVEAVLNEPAPLMRPGMQGVAKLAMDSAACFGYGRTPLPIG